VTYRNYYQQLLRFPYECQPNLLLFPNLPLPYPVDDFPPLLSWGWRDNFDKLDGNKFLKMTSFECGNDLNP